MAVHILGIRHHGVGSARHVREALERIQPDIILVEGPPEITEVLHHVGNPGLTPPVAIMVYNSADPRESTFYPFSEFSPEWVAIAFANENKIPVKAIDLPSASSFAWNQQQALQNQEPIPVPVDPMTVIAQSAGYTSGEQFWEHHFEYTSDEQHFESVQHVMSALRSEGLESSLDVENEFREAYMRQILQATQNEMYERIAVICGAWHGPALAGDFPANEDKKILKNLPKTKIKITCTWIPWTNDRLSMQSGYGAGILSPGWYKHLWDHPQDFEIPWLTKVAKMFRDKGMDMSTAHVIEAYKLARSLAIMRNQSFVSLQELNDAVLSVMCMGDHIQLELVRQQLIIGELIGNVPDEVPKVPLQEDFEATIKSLRLKLSAAPKQHDLDLRNENDLERSKLFHRLAILGIPWASSAYSRSKGTFKESWMLRWTPEMMIQLIDKAYLGNTVALAAQAILTERSKASQKVSEIAELIQKCIPAALFDELDELLLKINELSSISSDIMDLMKALPGLIDVARYGDVRKSDVSILSEIIHQLLIKVNVGLTNACYGLDETKSFEMFGNISALHHALKIYANPDEESVWLQTLHKTLDKSGINAVILGCICRLLLDAQEFDEPESSRRISVALSVQKNPVEVAAWLEGFLRGSGSILLYDQRLWNLIYEWVEALNRDTFLELVPLLRRTFSKFEFGERRQLGEKARHGLIHESAQKSEEVSDLDTDLAESILPTLQYLLNPQNLNL